MSVKERKACTFIWTIENFAYSLEGVNYWSPRFQCNFIQLDWLFTVERGRNVDDDITKFQICPSIRKEFAYLVVEKKAVLKKNFVDFELSILGSDGSVFVCDKQDLTLALLSSQFNPYCRGLFSEKKETFLPSGNLTVRFRLWSRDVEVKESRTIFGRTLIGMERVSFLMTLKDFSLLRPSHECSLCIDDKFKQVKSLNFTLRLIEQNALVASVSATLNDDLAVGSNLKILMLDANGMIAFVWGDRIDMLSKQETNMQSVWFQSLFEDESKRDLYFPGDVLSLRCECLIFGQSIERYIEDTKLVLEGKTLSLTKNSDIPNSGVDDLKRKLENKCSIM